MVSCGVPGCTNRAEKNSNSISYNNNNNNHNHNHNNNNNNVIITMSRHIPNSEIFNT